MKVGDLVWLREDMFYEHDENIGIVIKMIQLQNKTNIVEVLWGNGEVCTYSKIELETI